MIYYLYVKTHNQTGLKYLGQTKQNPYEYLGSGYRWSNHLNVHGNDISTELLQECETIDEIKKWGIYYSELWNVVEKDDWANLKPENGNGGFSKEDARKGGSIGGLRSGSITGPLNRLLKRGMCGLSHEQRVENGKKFGSNAGKIGGKMLWVNNGITQTRIAPESQVPAGYTRGMLKRSVL